MAPSRLVEAAAPRHRLGAKLAVMTYREGETSAEPRASRGQRASRKQRVPSLVDGVFEALGINAVVFGAVDATLAKLLQHFAGARQLGTGDLSLLAPEA
jgi:hypothetical protein